MASRGRETFKGLREKYGEKVEQAALKALQKNAEAVQQEAKSRCPVKTGRLQQSIHIIPKRGGKRLDIVADAEDEAGFKYARIVEFSPKINKPFLYPAMDAKREECRKNMIHAIQEALRK